MRDINIDKYFIRYMTTADLSKIQPEYPWTVPACPRILFMYEKSCIDKNVDIRGQNNAQLLGRFWEKNTLCLDKEKPALC